MSLAYHFGLACSVRADLNLHCQERRSEMDQHSRVVVAMRPSLRRTEYHSELQRQGFDVISAESAIHCIELLRAVHTDALVLESDLPGGGGETVLEIMDMNSSLSHIPVLVVIPDLNWSSTYQISRYRIDDFAVQPVASEKLVPRVKRLLSRSLIPVSVKH
jgi:DNA-binding response OmpR family regulator